MNKPLILGSGLSSSKDLPNLVKVCKAAIINCIRMFDTTPDYHTDELLCSALRICGKELGVEREDIKIQTKISPSQMYDDNVGEFFKRELQKMKLDYVDSLLMHWPVQDYLVRTWEIMLRLKEQSLAHKIGICNLRLFHMQDLESMGIIPEIIQIERHPLNTFEGETEFCREHGIMQQDYSPICKMHSRIKDNSELQKIADRHGMEIGQIVMRWHIDTGAIPVFTSTKPERVASYSHIDEFSLSYEEIEVISSLNVNHKFYLESLVCPGF